jgi:heat shock protein HspQ
MHESLFGLGELVRHRMFGYRGVIYDVDAVFDGDDQWYDAVAKSRPPKDRPWYHVLVDGQPVTTYVAERNLQSETDPRPIRHPLMGRFFGDYQDGRYRLRLNEN